MLLYSKCELQPMGVYWTKHNAQGRDLVYMMMNCAHVDKGALVSHSKAQHSRKQKKDCAGGQS